MQTIYKDFYIKILYKDFYIKIWLIMQTFLKPFKKLAGRVLLGLKPLALRAR
jgi:hypothetical protein